MGDASLVVALFDILRLFVDPESALNVCFLLFSFSLFWFYSLTFSNKQRLLKKSHFIKLFTHILWTVFGLLLTAFLLILFLFQVPLPFLFLIFLFSRFPFSFFLFVFALYFSFKSKSNNIEQTSQKQLLVNLYKHVSY